MGLGSAVFAAVLLAASPLRAAEFSPVTSLPEAYAGHTLVASPSHLYNIGGIGGTQGVGTAHRVFYAAVGAQGGLGAWQEGPALPEGVFFHASVRMGGTLLVLGGYHYLESIDVSNVVYTSQLGADGRPGEWRAASPLPQPVFFPSAAVWNGRVYVTGGWNGSALTSAVYSALLLPDGSLGAWRTESALPEGVYTHAAVSDGTLYVIGGVVNGGSEIHNTVYYAGIEADGSLRPWAATTPLPRPLSNHGASVLGGRVLLTGGWDGLSPSNESLQSPIEAGGTLGAWTALATLPRSLYLHGQAAVGGYLYVSGGSDGTIEQDAVYSLALPPALLAADSQAPRTTLSYDGPVYGQAPAFLGAQTALLLAAQDDRPGPLSTRYGLDQAALSEYQGPLAAPAEGAHWLRYYSIDAAGNTEAVQISSIAVDATAPSVTIEAGAPRAVLPSGEVYVSSSTRLSPQAEDPVSGGVASGVAEVLLSVDGQAARAIAEPFLLPAVDGAHTLSAVARDHLGNASAPRAYTFFIDQTPPATTAAPAGGGPILGASALVTLSAADAGAGLHHIEYSLDGGAWTAGGALALEEGKHELRYRSQDHVANWEAVRAASYRVDATPPLTTLVVGSPVVSLLGQDIVTPETLLSFSAEDPVSSGLASGVARIIYSLDGGAEQVYTAPFTLPAGEHTLRCYAQDAAGNVEASRTTAVSVGAFLTDSVAGRDSVDLSGGSRVTGAVRSNGTITASGGSAVDGTATAAAVTLKGKSSVSGAVTEGRATLSAGPDVAAMRAWAASRGTGEAVSLASDETLTLPAGVYYFSSLTLSAGAALKVSGRAEVFVAGPVRVSGQAQLNAEGSPDDLWVVTDGSEVSLAGQGRAAWNLYAPEARVSFSGGGQFAGRVWGRAVALTGHAAMPPAGVLPAKRHGPEKPVRLAKASASEGGSAGRRVLLSKLEPGAPAGARAAALPASAGPPARVEQLPAPLPPIKTASKRHEPGQAVRLPKAAAPLAIEAAALALSRLEPEPPAGRVLSEKRAAAPSRSLTDLPGQGARPAAASRRHDPGQAVRLPKAAAPRAAQAAALALSRLEPEAPAGRVLKEKRAAAPSLALADLPGQGPRRAVLDKSRHEPGAAKRLPTAIAPAGPPAGSKVASGRLDRVDAPLLLGGTVRASRPLPPGWEARPAPASRRHEPGAARRLPPASVPAASLHGSQVASSRLDAEKPALRLGGAVNPALPLPTGWQAALPPAAKALRKPFAMTPLALAKGAALSLVKKEGSVVRSADRSAVVIPHGAASTALAVTVSPAPRAQGAQERRQGAMEKKGLASAGPGVEFGPGGTRFEKPVTLELPYDLSAAGAVAIHYWNPRTSDWEPLVSSVDRQAGLVRAQTDHFSLYQVLSSASPAAQGQAALAFGEVYAYPNPARRGQNPVLHVEAGSAERVEARLYDVSGALVHSVSADGARPAFELTWDVSSVGSGVYLYTVTATKQGGGRISTKGRLAVIR